MGLQYIYKYFFITDKELIAAKERQEIELTAQRQTLNEQRTHIDILDSALTNAQANVVKLEEEVGLCMESCTCHSSSVDVGLVKHDNPTIWFPILARQKLCFY